MGGEGGTEDKVLQRGPGKPLKAEQVLMVTKTLSARIMVLYFYDIVLKVQRKKRKCKKRKKENAANY